MLNFCSWPSDDSLDRPFEEFLIAACQYNALSYYATELDMSPQAGPDKTILSNLFICIFFFIIIFLVFIFTFVISGKFYNGVSDLFVRTPQRALGRFMTITPQQLQEAPYFCSKILGLELPNEFCSNAFYEKVSHLSCTIFG